MGETYSPIPIYFRNVLKLVDCFSNFGYGSVRDTKKNLDHESRREAWDHIINWIDYSHMSI